MPVHNRVIFYVIFPAKSIVVRFGSVRFVFFLSPFSSSYFSLICLLLHFLTTTATNFSFYSYLLIIILTMITQKKSMDIYMYVCMLIGWSLCSLGTWAICASTVVRVHITLSLSLCTYCIYRVLYTMQVLIDNTFCRHFQKAAHSIQCNAMQCIVLFLLWAVQCFFFAVSFGSFYPRRVYKESNVNRDAI